MSGFPDRRLRPELQRLRDAEAATLGACLDAWARFCHDFRVELGHVLGSDGSRNIFSRPSSSQPETKGAVSEPRPNPANANKLSSGSETKVRVILG